ncbi:MAG TPA: NAD-dependent epimerase/dehydratase family protein [Bryobacteraceae bacterium]|nr:NAD-dependent epimerase/dehydratase family protein [Bryobacteraceae bacterium]
MLLACRDEAQLDGLLSTPSDADRAALADVTELIVLGAGGKMGPSLIARARRAAPHANIVAVARQQLDLAGAQCIVADLLDRAQIEALPDSANVIFLAGRKFGSAGREPLTWATNALLPALVAERYRKARIVALSSGNVYPLTVSGASELTSPTPAGEYAQSVLARERIFEYVSACHGTQVALLRLNYAIDLRYGVLHDIGQKVFRREPVSLAMSAVNVIWQGDANSVVLRSLAFAAAPPFVMNVTGLETLRVRAIANLFGGIFGIEPVFDGVETETALLSDAALCHRLMRPASITAAEMIAMTAEWIRAGNVTWNKPTHFEVRDGRF